MSPTTVTLTGTGIPQPSPTRAGAGTLIRSGATAVQIDAGRSTVTRLAQSGVKCSDLTVLLLTHHHSDHITDTAEIAHSRWVQAVVDYTPLPIVVPDGPLAHFCDTIFDALADDIAVRRAHLPRLPELRTSTVTFPPGPTPIEVFANDDVTITAVAVHHEPVDPAVAYRVDTADGSVVVSGDTRACREVEELAQGVDVLVHEACRATALRDVIAGTMLEPLFEYHTDTVELGALAQRAGVEKLVLTHLISEPTRPEQVAGFAADVRSGGFSGTLIVGDDLTTVTIPPRDQGLTR